MRGSSTWWYVFAISFVVVALAESFLPEHSLASSTPRRWTSNSILLAISSGLALCTYQLTGVALACSMAANSHGALNHVGLPNWVRFVFAFAILDLTAYASHRMFHAVDPMWRVHSVHHSETDLDLTTGFRFHPVEAVFVQGLFLIVIAVLGLPPGAVVLVTLAVVIQDFFTHANLRFSERADRWLRILIVTPGMHRVHHSESISQQNSNFGTIFSAWDRLFGTYSQGLEPVASTRCGLTEIQNGSELNAARLLWLPFRRRPTNNPGP